MRGTLTWMAAAACLVAGGVACGGDGGTGPNDLNFPRLDDAVIAENCIRGTTTAGRQRSGDITATDCEQGVGSYWETWRVRVADAGPVTFRVDAPQFDAVLIVAEVIVANGDFTNVTLLDADDDTNGDDPELTVNLLTGHEYLVVVLGFDLTETGSYTLQLD